MVTRIRLPMSLARPTDVARVDVRFDATAPGDASATLVATYDGGKKRTTQINGRALATSLSVSTDGDVDFGPVCIGQHKTRDFILMANDQGAFKLASISDPGAPFSVTIRGAGSFPPSGRPPSGFREPSSRSRSRTRSR